MSTALLNEQNFVPIPGYSSYLINDEGKIYSTIRGRILKPSIVNKHRKGKEFLMIQLKNDINRAETTVYIYKLVAKLFLPQVKGYSKIRFKDGNRINVAASNLEYYNINKSDQQVSIHNCIEAFNYYISDKMMLIEIFTKSPQLIEKHITNIRWVNKEKFTSDELIYKDWCNGDDYSLLAKKHKLGKRILFKTIREQRAILIANIMQDVSSGLLIKPKPLLLPKATASERSWKKLKEAINNK